MFFMLWKWQVINDLRWHKWKIGKVDSENVVPILLSRSFSAARKGHVFGAQIDWLVEDGQRLQVLDGLKSGAQVRFVAFRIGWGNRNVDLQPRLFGSAERGQTLRRCGCFRLVSPSQIVPQSQQTHPEEQPVETGVLNRFIGNVNAGASWEKLRRLLVRYPTCTLVSLHEKLAASDTPGSPAGRAIA